MFSPAQWGRQQLYSSAGAVGGPLCICQNCLFRPPPHSDRLYNNKTSILRAVTRNDGGMRSCGLAWRGTTSDPSHTSEEWERGGWGFGGGIAGAGGSLLLRLSAVPIRTWVWAPSETSPPSVIAYGIALLVAPSCAHARTAPPPSKCVGVFISGRTFFVKKNNLRGVQQPPAHYLGTQLGGTEKGNRRPLGGRRGRCGEEEETRPHKTPSALLARLLCVMAMPDRSTKAGHVEPMLYTE